MTSARNEPTELERVLAALADEHVRSPEERRDAARLLREMARDFNVWARYHARGCIRANRIAGVDYCGLDAARARWRLSE